MARITIELPEKFDFSAEIPIRISDINYGGHLGHDSILTLTHEARVRFLRSYGFTELDIDGPGLIVSDAAIVYKSEAHYGEVLIIEVAVRDFNKYGCDIIYKLSEKDEEREVARAKTGIVFYDYEGNNITFVPESFKKIINNQD